MQTPPQVSFLGMAVDDKVEAACLHEIEKLERYSDRITSSRVTISKPHERHRTGTHYSIHILLEVPGGEVVVSRDPPAHASDEKWELALREAFDQARRQLQDHMRRLNGKVKSREGPEWGRVERLYPQSGYGFIHTPDGEELYFHENSLLQGQFEKLGPGDEVSFVFETGDEGPQAATVRLVKSSQAQES